MDNFEVNIDFKISPGSVGKAKIEERGNAYILYVDELKWMIAEKNSNRPMKEFFSSYDLASGNVLLSGLGFGILAQWIAKKAEVSSVTVIEQNQDVLDLFLKNNKLDPKVKVYINDIKTYTDNQHYDWAILDHYEEDRKPTKIGLEQICSNLTIDN